MWCPDDVVRMPATRLILSRLRQLVRMKFHLQLSKWWRMKLLFPYRSSSMNRSQLASYQMNSKLATFTPQAREIQLKGSIELSRNHVDMHILSKVLEKVVHRQIYQLLESSWALSTSKFGFRRDHSCSDLLLSVVDDWLSARDSKLCTAVVFLDLT